MARFGMGGPGGMHNINTIQKPKDFFKTWKKLILYCKPYLPAIITALLLSIIWLYWQLVSER